MNRCYSILEIKSFDEDQRIIEGVASTPSVDRMGDIVEPEGMQAKFPVPLLWQHDSGAPIGQVLSAKRVGEQIIVKAKLAKIDEAGSLKDRIDSAWQMLRSGLVRGLSIGFRSLESAKIEGTFGMRFLKWELLELSAVTVPANADATITNIKSIDKEFLSASGLPKIPVVKINLKPGATGKTQITHKQKDTTMNVSDQIKSFESTRATKSSRMSELMEEAGKEGVTLDAAQTEEYDGLDTEIKAIDQHLTRLHRLAENIAANAKQVSIDANGDSVKASDSRVRTSATVALKTQLPKGIEFARYAMCLGQAKGDRMAAFNIAKSRFPECPNIITTLKTAVEAGSTMGTTWAAPLVEYNQFTGDFLEFLRPMTIIGKFGNDGVPALRRIPFNVHVRGQTSGGAGYWVGEGRPKPLTKFDFNDTYLGWAKVANIAVLTEELMRFSNPAAEAVVRDSLAAALIARLDTDFIDPAKALVANVSPASITNGVTPVVSSGDDADAVRCDVKAVFTSFIAANITPTNGVWIMPATIALSLMMMRNALGQPEFPGISMTGGTFAGLPVIVSEYVPTDSNGAFIVIANASDIWLADDGQISIDISREASLQMDDAPTNASYVPTPGPSPVPTSLVSMFQTDSVAIRAERFINWKKRRAEAVGMISGVNWGTCAS